MKTILQFLFVLASAGMAWAQTQIVVPGGLENTEGNSSSGDLFGTFTARIQQVYSAFEFASLSAPIARIDAVSFRLDAASLQTFIGARTFSMFLSTTMRSPENLSTVFDDNTGSDVALVFGRPILFRTTGSGEPRPFEVRIPLTSPFYYEPEKGNLCLDMLTSAGTSVLLLDAQLAVGDGIGRVVGENALSGVVDTLGYVTRFEITPIPEPSASAIFILSVSSASFLMTIGRNQRRRFQLKAESSQTGEKDSTAWD